MDGVILCTPLPYCQRKTDLKTTHESVRLRRRMQDTDERCTRWQLVDTDAIFEPGCFAEPTATMSLLTTRWPVRSWI